MRVRRLLQVATSALALLTACADPTLPTSDGGAEASRSSLPPTGVSEPGLDGEFAEIARSVPSFGGMYFDRKGELHIQLQDSVGPGPAEQASLALLRRHNITPPAKIHAHRVRYNVLSLLEWKSQARNLLGLPGVVFVDFDETENAVSLGISSFAVGAAVRRAAQDLGIPPYALRFQVAEAPVLSSTVRDKIRPAVGGLQIMMSSSTTCTMGFSAIRSGVRGFLTNSHCTNTQGGTESTHFFQPYLAPKSTTIVGTETVDPVYFTGGACPAGKRCRYSDAAFAQGSSGVSFAAQIAVTDAVGTTGPGSLTIARYGIVTGEYSQPFLNLFLLKTGRTSGTTGGYVTQTCADYPATSTITMLCQNVMDAYGDFGDSGAAVWWESNTITQSRPYLAGLMWGITTSPRKVFFSSMGNIRAEIGTLQTIF